MLEWSPDDLKKNLDQGKRVFLKLWKKGCGACKLSVPAIERLEANNQYDVTFAKICTDDHPEILEISDSEVLPMFFVFKDKKMLAKQPGFKGLKKLEELLDSVFS